MSTKSRSNHNIHDATIDLGLAVGSILPAIVQYPPTSPEAAKITVGALKTVLDSHLANGAPPKVATFIEAVIIAVDHYAGHD